MPITKMFFQAILIVTVLFQIASAEDFPSDEHQIGDEFTKGFSETKGMQAIDHKSIEIDHLKIGGSMQADWMGYVLKSTSQNDFVTTPMTLELYLDSQLKNDVRTFFKGRFINDGSVDESMPSPLTGVSQKKSTGSLDEMKISFHSERIIFWTIGLQKVKWGASKFWNPTDFLNLQKRDFLRQDDLRSGVSMVKAHIPLRDSNLYLIGVSEAANETSQIGLSGRIEIPFSAGEWSYSTYARKGQETKMGTDLSFALNDLDIYAEGAQTDHAKDKSLSGGLTYEVKYSDEDAISLGLEGFWQENGTEDVNTYLSLVNGGKWVPFNIGKSYTSATIFLSKPGSWNFSNFILQAIQNNSDYSQYYRLTWMYSGMTDIIWTMALGSRTGEAASEMKFFNQTLDGWVQLKVMF